MIVLTLPPGKVPFGASLAVLGFFCYLLLLCLWVDPKGPAPQGDPMLTFLTLLSLPAIGVGAVLFVHFCLASVRLTLDGTTLTIVRKWGSWERGLSVDCSSFEVTVGVVGAANATPTLRISGPFDDWVRTSEGRRISLAQLMAMGIRLTGRRREEVASRDVVLGRGLPLAKLEALEAVLEGFLSLAKQAGPSDADVAEATLQLLTEQGRVAVSETPSPTGDTGKENASDVRPPGSESPVDETIRIETCTLSPAEIGRTVLLVGVLLFFAMGPDEWFLGAIGHTAVLAGLALYCALRIKEISVELTRQEVVVRYTLLKCIRWHRRASLKDVFEIGRDSVGAQVLLTSAGTYRITRPAAFSLGGDQAGVAALLRRHFARHGWEPRPRFAVRNCAESGEREVVLVPAGIRAMGEITGGSYTQVLPGLLVPGMFLVLLAGGVGSVMGPALFDVDPKGELWGPLTIAAVVLVVVWVMWLIARSQIILRPNEEVHKPGSTDLSESVRALVVYRVAGGVPFRAGLLIHGAEPISMHIRLAGERGDDRLLELCQGDKTVCIGAALGHDELRALKATLEQELASAPHPASPDEDRHTH